MPELDAGGDASQPGNVEQGGNSTGAANNDEGGLVIGGVDEKGQSGSGGSLDPDLAEYAKSKGWTGPEDFGKALKSYRELEQRFSAGEHKKPAEKGEGNYVPETPEDYDLAMPDFSDNVTYNEELGRSFREVARDAGLTQAQASKLHYEMSKHLAGEQEAYFEQRDQAMRKTADMLVQEWGDPAGVTYQENAKLAFAHIKGQPGLLEAYVKSGLLVPIGEGRYQPTDPSIVFAHAQAGRHMTAESDGFAGLGAAGTGKNPWAAGQEDPDAQGRIFRKDRKMAEALIRQAGKDPRQYGL